MYKFYECKNSEGEEAFFIFDTATNRAVSVYTDSWLFYSYEDWRNEKVDFEHKGRLDWERADALIPDHWRGLKDEKRPTPN